MVRPPWKAGSQALKKLNIKLPYVLAISILGINSKAESKGIFIFSIIHHYQKVETTQMPIKKMSG
jgi:hypothetical protein